MTNLIHLVLFFLLNTKAKLLAEEVHEMHIMRYWELFQGSTNIYLLCSFSSPAYMTWLWLKMNTGLDGSLA